MVVVFISAGDHVVAAFECEVRQHAHVLHANRAKRTSAGAEPIHDFGRVRRANVFGFHNAAEFGFAELMITAHHDKHRLAIGHHTRLFICEVSGSLVNSVRSAMVLKPGV